MHIRPIHPFPARMAPDLALDALAELRKGSVVLDPMAGSGTVLRQAVNLGHRAVGFDMDPLAVLMTRVWTTDVASSDIRKEYDLLLEDAERVDLRTHRLPWIASDPETSEFISYWFGNEQRRALHRLAYVLYKRRQSRLGDRRRAAVNALTIALSRIIITKEQGASLARDASHSRPHKVVDESDYDVFSGLARSVAVVSSRISEAAKGRADVRLGDARKIPLRKGSVDAILTSPPYLNAIDYMRGHRLALVWFGYQLSQLRSIRSSSIGAERACSISNDQIGQVSSAMVSGDDLPKKFRSMIQRYAGDLISMTSEASRVLKAGGVATFVVGNSCLRSTFIRNSEGVHAAGKLAGLNVSRIVERELPASNRYLPITASGALSKRMRTETVLTFVKG